MKRTTYECNQSILLITDNNRLKAVFSKAITHRCFAQITSSYKTIQKICQMKPPHMIFIDQALPDNLAEIILDEFHSNYPQTVTTLLVDRLDEDFVFRIWGKVKELIHKPVTGLEFLSLIDRYCLYPSCPVAGWQLALVRILQQYPDPALSGQEIARELGMNASYFSRLFKSVTGKSFQQTLTETRINAARQLMVKDNLQIKEIALKVGYKRISSFSRLFHQMTGESPSEYRNRFRTNQEK